MDWVNSFVSWMFKKRMHQIELFMKYPMEVQTEILRKNIRIAKDTEFGKKFAIGDLSSYEEFKQRIPIMEYDEFKEWILRCKQGESNILWPGQIKWFAKSSGTTSDKSKFIPITPESLEECHFKGGKDMLTLYCNNYEETTIFTGKSLTLSGTRKLNEPLQDSYYGDLSAIILQNLPLLAEWARTPSIDVAMMENWEEKIKMIIKETANENVTSLAGVPSWLLLIMQTMLKEKRKSNIHEIWPNLEVFFHGGVYFDPYQKQFQALCGKKEMRFWETYNASEGFFGLQFEKNKREMLLMLDYGVFYEFIPIGESTAHAVPLEGVQAGKIYSMVITTNGGLWRYNLGDTVEFHSLEPFTFTIKGRTKSFINAFGEELMVENADKAIETASSRANCVVNEYTASPVFLEGGTSAGLHHWVIEFYHPPENLAYFEEVLDNTLKSLNSDYEAKRSGSFILDKPRITIVPAGTFYNWMKSKQKLGGQFKVPRLVNRAGAVDEILLHANA